MKNAADPEVLKENKEQRHIRGGAATKEKYRKLNR